jgi:hypothetical protein
MQNICHIVNWYPNKWNSIEALWVKRHIEALDKYRNDNVNCFQINYGLMADINSNLVAKLSQNISNIDELNSVQNQQKRIAFARQNSYQNHIIRIDHTISNLATK